MKSMLTILAGLLLAGAAHGGDVYVVTDAQGNRSYTDRPQTLPAERVDVHVSETNAADAARAAQQMERAAADDATYGAQRRKRRRPPRRRNSPPRTRRSAAWKRDSATSPCSTRSASTRRTRAANDATCRARKSTRRARTPGRSMDDVLRG